MRNKRASRRVRLTQAQKRRRHREAERWRLAAFCGPPLSEWELMAMYEAVEAERRMQG